MFSTTQFKSRGVRIALVFLSVIILLSGSLILFLNIVNDNRSNSVVAYELFNNCSEITQVLNEENAYYYAEPDFLDEDFLIREELETGGFDGAAAQEDTIGTGSGGANEVSTTNVQIEGIDESDIVKSNGEYIFLLNGQSLLVFDVMDPTNPVQIATASVPFSNTREMFLIDDNLIIFGEQYNYEYDVSEQIIFHVDVSDPSDPEEIEKIKLEGNFVTARLLDDTIYTIAQKNVYLDFEEKQSAEDVLPQVGVDDEFEVAAECNQIAQLGNAASTFTTVLSYNIESNNFETDVLLGDTSTVFMSKNNLYLATTVYEEFELPEPRPFGQSDTSIRVPRFNNPSTDIFKLDIEGTNVEFEASGNVAGTLLNQFSLDEFDGHLRVATTSQNEDNNNINNVFILDDSMQQVGEITNLAEDESIYSVRFMGETAYVVTFRQIDPLFVLDLSDPTNPEVTGELKIPGFSNYLHPVGENLLMGVGRDATEFGRVDGVKISLFDVSDMQNPKEIDTISFGASEGYTEVANDHKAFFFDPNRKLAVIPLQYQGEKETIGDADRIIYTPTDFEGFAFIEVENKELIDAFTLEQQVDLTSSYYYGNNGRTVSINEFAFTIKNGTINVVNMDTLEVENQIFYDEGDVPVVYF